MRRRKVMEIKSIKIKDAYVKYLLAKKAEGVSSKTLDIYMLHVEARVRLEQSLRAENERYVERDIGVEQLRNILQFSKKPKEDYIL